MKNLILALTLALTGCTSEEQLRPKTATAQIMNWVPVGTSLANAKHIMEQRRFTCSLMTNSNFGDLKAIDFLYCDRSDSSNIVTPIVVRRWQVALILGDGKVSDVQVTTGLIGP